MVQADRVEQPELLHSDLSRSVPAKHEASDEILVEIGTQDSDTGKSRQEVRNHCIANLY